jgi:hypothetical protein
VGLLSPVTSIISSASSICSSVKFSSSCGARSARM